MTRTFKSFLNLKWLLPDRVVGALAGFGLGVMACMSLAFLGLETSRYASIPSGVFGALLGYMVGVYRAGPPGRAHLVAWWCATMTGLVGLVGFLIGFIGPIILERDSPQGPLLGIFLTGPLGAVAGALCGALIGLVVPDRITQQKTHTPWRES